MAKNTVPVTIWGVPVWKGRGRQKNLHLGTPRNHKVFVTIIWGLINKGRCAQIPAIFENLIPRPEEKKDIFVDPQSAMTPVALWGSP